MDEGLDYLFAISDVFFEIHYAHGAHWWVCLQ